MLNENASFKEAPTKITVIDKPFDGEKDKRVDVTSYVKVDEKTGLLTVPISKLNIGRYYLQIGDKIISEEAFRIVDELQLLEVKYEVIDDSGAPMRFTESVSYPEQIQFTKVAQEGFFLHLNIKAQFKANNDDSQRPVHIYVQFMRKDQS